jgi:hypothetical protein
MRQEFTGARSPAERFSTESFLEQWRECLKNERILDRGRDGLLTAFRDRTHGTPQDLARSRLGKCRYNNYRFQRSHWSDVVAYEPYHLVTENCRVNLNPRLQHDERPRNLTLY